MGEIVELYFFSHRFLSKLHPEETHRRRMAESPLGSALGFSAAVSCDSGVGGLSGLCAHEPSVSQTLRLG